MATNAISKIDAAAEKAYAQAAAKEAPAKEAPARDAVIAKSDVAAPAMPVSKPAAKKAVAPKVTARPAVKQAPARKPAAKKPTARPTAHKVTMKVAAKVAPKAAKIAAKPVTTNPILKFKDTIMAKANQTDFAATAKEMAADVQTRVKTAYAKSGELASEVTEFSKGNVEALVESGKILVAGIQTLGREEIANSKGVVETVTEDLKKIAAVQSPTEFMQLQGELARRNFDAAVAFGSKRTEALVKLYNDAFAPISNRVSLAAERIKKAA